MVKEMLNILMDGIKDANMLMEYYYECDTTEHQNWFYNHAKMRYEQVVSDYAFIKNQLGIDQKVREGDVMAEALHSHIAHEIMELKNKMTM